MNEFTIGVVSGLVTSLIVFVLQLGYLRVLRPWIEELLYRDLMIEGSWLGEYPENADLKETVQLARKGHRVTGTITVTGGPDVGHVYSVEGSFKNLILTLSFAAQDSRRLDRGTYTFQAQDNGRCLRGYSTFYQDHKDAIACMKSIWTRN
jgi:hypothetical protein